MAESINSFQNPNTSILLNLPNAPSPNLSPTLSTPAFQAKQKPPPVTPGNHGKGQGHNSTALPGPSASGPPQKHLASTHPINQTLTRKNLQELTKAVDPNEQLDDDVEEYLLNYAEGYMEDLIEGSCLLAAHRKGNTVDCKDVQTHLERSCNVWIPGFGADEVRPFKRAPITEAHKQRMALIKKTVKKY